MVGLTNEGVEDTVLKTSGGEEEEEDASSSEAERKNEEEVEGKSVVAMARFLRQPSHLQMASPPLVIRHPSRPLADHLLSRQELYILD